ncbi:MAG: NosD domain-containing protein [Armatimonadia bacterium]
MGRSYVVLAVLLVTMLVCGAALAATINVPTDYTTIQAAIDAASDGDTIIVAQGTYKEYLDFKAAAITLTSTDPNSSTVVARTIIDGQDLGPVVQFVSGEMANSVITGFTITNGTATDGGGILCDASSPTISSNRIRLNKATSRGGGICCLTGSAPKITANNISGNTVDSGGDSSVFGGGIYCRNSSAEISSNTIMGNTAVAYDDWPYENGAACGGGITCSGGTPLISANVITSNSASGPIESLGGGIYLQSASGALVTGNTISGNTAPASSGDNYGGGICLRGSPSRIESNVLDGNSGRRGGGIFCDGASAAPVTGNVFVNNSATEVGGAICSDASAVITNNTFRANTAPAGAGGGIWCAAASPQIKNCIVASSAGGGGIGASASSTPNVSYCDVWGNTGGEYVGLTDPSGTNGNITRDPLFVSPATGDFRLKSRAGRWNGTAWVNDTVLSPCIDAGDPASPFANEPTPNGGRVNMGYDGNTVYASKTPPNSAPLAPTTVTITPVAPGPENLTGHASGATDVDGNAITYRYQWAKKKADGTWDRWSYTGEVLPKARILLGETWRVRAQAYDGALYSPWRMGPSTAIFNMAGVTPAPKTYGVPVTACVFASFRWPVQPASVPTRVQLKIGTRVIPTVLSWVTAERKIKLRPKTALVPNTFYRVNFDPGIVRLIDGRTIGWGENYWFKTAPAASPSAVSVAATPTASGAQLTVNLSAAATVRTVICNIAGRVVAELAERDLPAGVNSLVWNGRGNGGSKVPAGSYLVRVEAKGAEGTQTTAVTSLQIR